MTALRKLVGKRINGIFLNADHTRVVFRTTESEELGFYVHGDCCNTVYINHFQGKDVVGEGNTFDILRGALVTAVEEKEWIAIDDDETEYDDDPYGGGCVEDGFFTIRTDRGYIDFEVRNEHNGYYSGHLEELEPDFMEAEEMFPLTEDF
jgi:hypothetical protein